MFWGDVWDAYGICFGVMHMGYVWGDADGICFGVMQMGYVLG
jgi:hypothetical protein